MLHCTFKHPALCALTAGRPARALAVFGLWAVFAAGCATGDVAVVATIAGGEKITVPLGRGGAVPANEDGVQVNLANLMVSPEKKVIYVCVFTDSRKRPLRSVLVEDVSDETAARLVEDAAPKSSATGEWHGESEPLDLADPRANWLETISNTVRVFRFTLTFADGRKLVLLQGTLFPAPVKAAARHALGLGY